MIDHLLDRASDLEGAARAHLEARASTRMHALAARFEAEHDRARSVLKRLAGQGRDPAGSLAEALERGDLLVVLRAGRRHLATDDAEEPDSGPAPRRAPTSPPLAGGLRSEADESKVGPGQARGGGAEAGEARSYRDALADLMASLSAAAVQDSPPEQAGLLNGTLLAARILEAAESLSPTYRRVLVSRLTDLGSLLHLPAVPTPRRRG